MYKVMIYLIAIFLIVNAFEIAIRLDRIEQKIDTQSFVQAMDNGFRMEWKK